MNLLNVHVFKTSLLEIKKHTGLLEFNEKIFYIFIYVFYKKYNRPPYIKELVIITSLNIETCRKYLRSLKNTKLIKKFKSKSDPIFYQFQKITHHKKLFIEPLLELEINKGLKIVDSIIAELVSEYMYKQSKKKTKLISNIIKLFINT